MAVPDLLVRPVLYSDLEQSETSDNIEQSAERSSVPLYNCPVYMTRVSNPVNTAGKYHVIIEL